MAFDTLKFLHKYGIEYSTQGKKARPGWVQVHCPFCEGEQNFHLGIKLDGEYGHCWRCRGKTILKIVQGLLNCSWSEAKRILVEFKSRRSGSEYEPIKPAVGQRNSCTLPPEAGPLFERPLNYLLRRNFDPNLLIKNYGLLATGHLGQYAFRIIAPIYFDGKLVSYQGRDYTGKCPKELRYMACEKAKEVIHHKHILYGMDLAEGDSCAIVEGFTDCWRLGPGANGLFGTGFKVEQALLLVKRYKRIFLILDNEPAAQQISDELSWFLSGHGKEVFIVDALAEGEDPGGMEQDDANALMRELKLKGWN